jgi:hypothetical protein
MPYDITKHAGAGLQDLDDSTKMPLLNIIQQMSPQLIEGDDKYIEGSKAGDVFFSPTGELVKKPIKFVPIALRTVYVEWKPKTEGGGIVAMHPLSIKGRKDLGYEQGVKTKYDEWLGGNELKKTTYVLGFAEINGERTDVMLALAVTGQKVSRKLQEEIRKFRYDGEHANTPPPVFAREFELTTVRETNSNDQSYFNWKFENPRVLDFEEDEALLETCGKKFDEAKEFLPAPQAAEPVYALEVDDDDTDIPF